MKCNSVVLGAILFAPCALAAGKRNLKVHGIRHDRKLQDTDCNPTTETCDCMGDVAITTGLLKSSPSDFVCTSNDVRIADTDVLSVDGQTVGPFTCRRGDMINVQLAVKFENGASSRRSDIGLWLSQDGGDAETGDCEFNYFPIPPGVPGNADDPPDTCGDLKPKESVPPNIADPGIPLPAFDLTCDNGGGTTSTVTVGSCIGWKIPGADENCDVVAAAYGDNYAAATLPGTKSKCRCEDIPIDIIIEDPPDIAKTCDSTTLSADEESVVYGFTVTITNNNVDDLTSWSVTDSPIDFDDPKLNSGNNGPLIPGDNIFNPFITRSVPDAFSVNPFVDTVTLSADGYDAVTDDAECPPFVFSPAKLEATITCDEQGTSADGTNFIVTQTFSGSVCNTGGTKAKNVDVSISDGNGNDIPLSSTVPSELAAGDCVTFSSLPGSVTAGFTGTCDATFEATVTGDGKDIAGGVLTASALADCPVCDCP